MKLLNILFVNIYGQTQRMDNMNRRKIDGVLCTSICIGLCLIVWCSLAVRIFYYLMFRINPPDLLMNKSVNILLTVLLTGILNWYYNNSNRSFNLFQEYLDKNGKVWSMRKTFLILIGLYVIPFAFIFFMDFVVLK
jgi:hypothetical protein